MNIDSQWSFLQKFNYRLKFISKSSIEYALDILLWRVDPFVFKTAEFCKRNFNKVRGTLAHLWYEVKKIKRGFANLKNDVLTVLGIKVKYSNYNY